MQSGQWIGLSALATAIVAIGLGIGALVLALDKVEPAFVLGGGRFLTDSAGPGEFGFQREGEARRVPFPDLEGFGGELERRLPALGGALLGVSVSDGEGGAQVDVVIPGSAAEQAGVEAGDVITAVDGAETPEAAALLETVRAHEPGDELTLRVERGDEELELAVTLGQRRLSTAVPGTTEPPTPPAET